MELWWQDEARIGQQGTLTRIWAERGSRAAAPRDQHYAWCHLFGAICPGRGIEAALVLPHAVLIVDGAGWHQTGSLLRVPDDITLLHLPPHSPELNPVENVRAFLRSNKLSNRVFASYDAIGDACCDAWNWLVRQPGRITTIGARSWAQVTA